MLSATLATCILYDSASPLLFIPAFRGRRERRKICDGDKKKISCRKPQFYIVAALLPVRKRERRDALQFKGASVQRLLYRWCCWGGCLRLPIVTLLAYAIQLWASKKGRKSAWGKRSSTMGGTTMSFLLSRSNGWHGMASNENDTTTLCMEQRKSSRHKIGKPRRVILFSWNSPPKRRLRRWHTTRV